MVRSPYHVQMVYEMWSLMTDRVVADSQRSPRGQAGRNPKRAGWMTACALLLGSKSSRASIWNSMASMYIPSMDHTIVSTLVLLIH